MAASTVTIVNSGLEGLRISGAKPISEIKLRMIRKQKLFLVRPENVR